MLYSMLTTDEAKLREFGKRLAACRLLEQLYSG